MRHCQDTGLLLLAAFIFQSFYLGRQYLGFRFEHGELFGLLISSLSGSGRLSVGLLELRRKRLGHSISGCVLMGLAVSLFARVLQILQSLIWLISLHSFSRVS